MFDVTSELIKRCQLGEEEGWRELFSKTYPLSRWVVVHTLFNLAPHIVDEISQETMVALASSIGKIEDDIHLKRFVKRVARNKCINFIRSNREQFEEVPENIPVEDDPLKDNQAIEILHEAVAELKEPCQTIIRSRYLSNLSYKDIAGQTGIDIKQLGVRLGRCLAFLKNLLVYKHVSWEDIL